MRSPESRSPAVSTRRNGKPSITACASMASRVVPGISVTIARSVPSSALKSDDLPALGRPAITSSAPSRSRSPSGAVFSRSATRPRTTSHAPRTRCGATGPSSSSGKSMSYAMSASSSRISLRSAGTPRARPPARSTRRGWRFRPGRRRCRNAGRGNRRRARRRPARATRDAGGARGRPCAGVSGERVRGSGRRGGNIRRPRHESGQARCDPAASRARRWDR